MTHCDAARGGGGARARVCADAPAARGRIPGSLTTAVRRALSRAAHGGAAPCRQARTAGVALRGSGAAVVRAAQWRQGAGPACQMLPSDHPRLGWLGAGPALSEAAAICAMGLGLT
eukprot:scaffold23809_cov74-Phaeocystis_antarctica.AAC.5